MHRLNRIIMETISVLGKFPENLWHKTHITKANTQSIESVYGPFFMPVLLTLVAKIPSQFSGRILAQACSDLRILSAQRLKLNRTDC